MKTKDSEKMKLLQKYFDFIRRPHPAGIWALLVIITLPLVLGLVAPLTSSHASAADPGVLACQKLVVAGTDTDPRKVPTNLPMYKDCKTGYDAGYNNPNQNEPDSPVGPCNDTMTNKGMCENGFRQGNTDKKSTTNQPSSDTIGKDGAAKCKPYLSEKGLSKDVQKSNYDACITGYNGQFAGKNTEDACKSVPGAYKSACLAGHDAAINHNIVKPGEGGQGGETGATPAKTDGSNSDTSPDCESGGFNLSWILCPIINGLASAVDDIYSKMVQPLLVTQPIELQNTDKDPSHVYEIWSNFRIYGDILLIIVLLVVVFGQSIGGGVIDAYSAKKILPRLLAAAVLINISIYLVALAVDLTNVLGNGIINLIEQPFKDAGGFTLKLSGGAADLGMAALVTGGIFGALTIVPLLEFVFLFFLIPAFLTMLAILVTVMVRRGLIIFLVMVAPIAFALYCLPNTEQYFKKWWDLLLKTLMVYPIIAAIFGIANVLSITINTTTSGISQSVAGLVSIIALFVPLFLIPFSFKFAGGVLGKLTDVAQGMGKKAHEGMKGNPNDENSWQRKASRNLNAQRASKNLTGAALVKSVRPQDFSRGGSKLRKARLSSVRDAYAGFYGKQGMAAQSYEHFKEDSNVMQDLARFGTGAESRAAIEAKYDGGRNKDFTAADREQALFSSAAADRIGRTNFMRRQALVNPATVAYGIAPGEEGWNEAMAISRELSGGEKYDTTQPAPDASAPRYDPKSPAYQPALTGDAGVFRGLQNTYQYVGKAAAGRHDQSGATDGNIYNGYRAASSVGLYQKFNGKPSGITGEGKYFRGLWDRAKDPATVNQQDIHNFTSKEERDVFDHHDLRIATVDRAKQAVAVNAREMARGGSSGTGAAFDEGMRQSQLHIEHAGNASDPNNELRRLMETPEVVRMTRSYDPEDAERQRRAP
ncbi:MAG: hypothetical protein QFB86_02775 [Patescibacteria group bacterium]|nr:hypothetical protein [Patescibacteria group bacterium]